ncbi:MAG: flagellar basal body rod protein FlgB [Rhizobiales bacterium]|nr:flagellar basal body rod protein FlgB [Hyphomicrobiales bacterium]
MAITDLPILSMLRTKMAWHQERQRVLAENVANADTPGFQPRDLVAPETDRIISAPGAVALAQTNAGHMSLGGSGSSAFQSRGETRYDIRPAGNAVSLEDEMLKVAANQMDYQAATSLYGRSLALFRTALGKA